MAYGGKKECPKNSLIVREKLISPRIASIPRDLSAPESTSIVAVLGPSMKKLDAFIKNKLFFLFENWILKLI